MINYVIDTDDNNNFILIKLEEENEGDLSQKSLEDEVNEAIEKLKKRSWKYYLYTLFCCK